MKMIEICNNKGGVGKTTISLCRAGAFAEMNLKVLNGIQPNPEQPGKTFVQESLKSLTESIKELGGIIDLLTVEYVEKDDFFQIISGERRYRTAKIIGFKTLSCIVKEVDEQQRFLMQFIANIQRENIPPLEEAVGFRHLVEKFRYNQQRVATILNKSKSYVSQILGLERLSDSAMKKVQTSELLLSKFNDQAVQYFDKI